MGLFGFLADVLKSAVRTVYSPIRELYRRFFSELPRITRLSDLSQQLNGMITISGERLPTGSVEVIYAGLSGPAIDTGATGSRGSRVDSRVPDEAVLGPLTIRQGRVLSTSSRERLVIEPPTILRSEPALLIDEFTLIGSGFSRAHPHTIHFDGRIGSRDVRRSVSGVRADETRSRLSLTLPDGAPYRGSIIVVVERGAGDLTSASFSYRRGRRLNGFTGVAFRNIPDDYGCAGSDVTLRIDTPAESVFPFTIRRGTRVVVSDSFRVADGIGGVGLSHCCDYAATLSYGSGYLEPTGIKFNLTIYDTQTGDTPFAAIVSATSHAPPAQLPELYFSPDCTLIAIIDTRYGGGGNFFFVDLLRPHPESWGGNMTDVHINSFTATVTDRITDAGEQIIDYRVNGGAAVEQPIPNL